VTPEDSIAPFSRNTLDYPHIRKRMAELGIHGMVSNNMLSYEGSTLRTEDVWTRESSELHCDALVMVTARVPDDGLYQDLLRHQAEWSDAGMRSVRCIGDAEAPGLIAHAVYAGHRYARELDEPAAADVRFKRHFHADEPATSARVPLLHE
jgi:dimethylamine/trimethylamine dehydrogenase